MLHEVIKGGQKPGKAKQADTTSLLYVHHLADAFVGSEKLRLITHWATAVLYDRRQLSVISFLRR